MNPLQISKTLFSLLSFMIFGSGCSPEVSLIYYPEKELIATPAHANLPFEDLFLRTEDGEKINGWYVPFEGSQGVLLWFHGNAGNMGHRVNLLQRLHQELKLNILLIDYRGYGKSSGKISEEGTQKDARAAYDHLISRREINPGQIFIFGRSLGAAVAIELATEIRTAGLIIEAPFTSIEDMTDVVMPWLPFKGSLKTKYDSIHKIQEIQSPLLVMHGDQDRIIPFEQGQRIFESAKRPKTFYTIVGADHNNTYIVGGQVYFETLARFIEQLKK